jgi:hypothetical protein
MPLSAGRRLGPYEIVAPLGAAGMGEVYKKRGARRNWSLAITISVVAARGPCGEA